MTHIPLFLWVIEFGSKHDASMCKLGKVDHNNLVGQTNCFRGSNQLLYYCRESHAFSDTGRVPVL